MGLFSLTQELAIDLGTANTLIIHNGKVVVDEPSIVALDVHTGKLVAIGTQARQMHEKTNPNISGAGIMLTLQAASSWPIPVIYGPTPPESVTRRICCELIKPLRCCRLLMVVSPNPTASSWPGSSTPISDCAAPMPNRTFIGGVFRAGITRTSFRPKRCCIGSCGMA